MAINITLNRASGTGDWGQTRLTSRDMLKQCAIFAALSYTEIERLATLATEKQYEAGAAIIRAGDPADEVFILEEGKIALQMASPASPGRTTTVDLAFPGELLGWPALVEPHMHDLTAICLQKSRLLVLDAVRLRALVRNDNPTFKIMSSVIRCAMSRLSDTRQLLIAERLWAGKSD